MRKYIQLPLAGLILSTIIIGCNDSEDKPAESLVIHRELNKQYVLITDIQALQESNDEISNHVDSILNGLIEAEFVSSGYKKFDLDQDNLADIAFEIIDLRHFNPQGLPESFDHLAARVIPVSVQLHDNSTFGYVSAFNYDDVISGSGNWVANTGVPGTFMDAGQFQGQGEKYLAFRFIADNGFKYGWIKLYCSQHSDTLRIIEYAFNSILGGEIKAGQKE